MNRESKLNQFLDELTILADKTNQQLVFLDNAAIVLKESGFRSPEAESEYRIYTNVERKAILFLCIPANQGMGSGVSFIISHNF